MRQPPTLPGWPVSGRVIHVVKYPKTALFSKNCMTLSGGYPLDITFCSVFSVFFFFFHQVMNKQNSRMVITEVDGPKGASRAKSSQMKKMDAQVSCNSCPVPAWNQGPEPRAVLCNWATLPFLPS